METGTGNILIEATKRRLKETEMSPIPTYGDAVKIFRDMTEGRLICMTLSLDIRVNEDDFEIDIYEPESGECRQLQFPLSLDEHPEFDSAIGNEIYSWISLWLEELDQIRKEAGK